MKKVLCRTAAGKRYQVTVITLPDSRIERSYELVSKSKSLEEYSPADQDIFRSMESEISGLSADFADLEEELNRI